MPYSEKQCSGEGVNFFLFIIGLLLHPCSVIQEEILDVYQNFDKLLTIFGYDVAID